MTDEQALLAAVLARPDDDTPRLVYADFLDDHGDSDRAAFIRLQVEAARGPLPPRKRTAMARLEEANRAAWLAPFDAACAGVPITAEFRRGFVERIVGEADLPGRFPEVAAVCPVRHVEFNTQNDRADPTPAARMAACPQLARVRRLELRRFPEAVGAALLASPHLTGLDTLYLQWGWLAGAVELASRSPVARGLKHLWVWGATEETLTPGRGLGTLLTADWPALTQLRLHNLGLDADAVLATVRAAVERRWQSVLVFQPWTTIETAIAAVETAIAGGVPSVGVGTTSELEERVEPVPDGERVLRFHEFFPDGDAIIRWLIDNVPPGRFTRLGIVGCQTTVAGIRQLARWPGLAHLTSLDLRACGIQATSAQALAASPYLDALTELRLAVNGVGKTGKDALKKRFGQRVRITGTVS
jgi:uncharacterized protein (TIGR02996 family)